MATTHYEYDPLKWPPDMALAYLHLKCCQPGIDNAYGNECPCCGRLYKLKNSKWPSRDITKDFRNYGGGVPAYFSLVIYFIIAFLFITLVIVICHIYVLYSTCHELYGTYNECTSAFGLFKFCDSKILYQQLLDKYRVALAMAFNYLQLSAYFLLVIATIGTKVWLQHFSHSQFNKYYHILSRYALILKNIPRFYNLDLLRQDVLDIDSSIEICYLFYVYRTADYYAAFREYFDIFFKLRYAEKEYEEARASNHLYQLPSLTKKIKTLSTRYMYLNTFLNEHRNFANSQSKRAILVLNSIYQRYKVHARLKINELKKFVYYTFKMVGVNARPMSLFSENLAYPQEVHWKYIGESSTFKTKVRFETTILGFGFMLLSFGLFYFPMIKIDYYKIEQPGLGTLLGILISIAIIILAVVYRLIILKLMPTRRPSSRLAESYFIVITTVVFHFFFYVITPATYYVFVEIPSNTKLKQLFLAVLTFIGMTLLVAFLDMKYRLYNRRKKRLLYQHAYSDQMCQQRLHEYLSPPSFPIEFKLMVILNLWTFNAFYIFELPYLLFLFLLVLIVLYWVDKRNLYKHYKMQSYLSIELYLKIQKVYIILFLLCVSVGYAISTFEIWQRYLTIGIFIVAIIVNYSISYTYKRRESNYMQRTVTLKQAFRTSVIKYSFHHNLLEDELKQSFFVPPYFSYQSLASYIFNYGYLDVYNRYLNQFKNKQINYMLEAKAKLLFELSPRIAPRKYSELADLGLQYELLTNHPDPSYRQDSKKKYAYFQKPETKGIKFTQYNNDTNRVLIKPYETDKIDDKEMFKRQLVDNGARYTDYQQNNNKHTVSPYKPIPVKNISILSEPNPLPTDPNKPEYVESSDEDEHSPIVVEIQHLKPEYNFIPSLLYVSNTNEPQYSLPMPYNLNEPEGAIPYSISNTPHDHQDESAI